MPPGKKHRRDKVHAAKGHHKGPSSTAHPVAPESSTTSSSSGEKGDQNGKAEEELDTAEPTINVEAPTDQSDASSSRSSTPTDASDVKTVTTALISDITSTAQQLISSTSASVSASASSTNLPLPFTPTLEGVARRLQHLYLSHPSSSIDFLGEPESAPSTPRPYASHQPPPPYYEAGRAPSFVATPRNLQPLKPPNLWRRFKLLVLQTVANAISTYFLVFIVLWALADRAWSWWRGSFNGGEFERSWDEKEKWKGEKCVKDVGYYARQCGYDIEDQVVETADGYLLRVHRVVVPGRSEEENRKGYPVLIMHGLFQSSGSFVTSEERSLAFWLAEKGGYQVYLGNNRGVFNMGHRTLKRSDPRFWDFNIKELALYDLPALVDHVRLETGFDKIAFIGHSQGNATMFCSLAQGMVPSLGLKLSVFISLAPAVFAGPLTSGFPFWAIKSVQWHTWRRLFGVLDFIPLMRWSYDWTPGEAFGRLGYIMFSFLFNWTDANWLKRRKPKMFRFTPSPVPSAGIFWWTGYGGFSTRGCVLDPAVYKWYDQRFPPLSIYHGGKDLMVLTDPLLARLKDRETDVRVIRVLELADGEHCDFFWHVDAVELCFGAIMEDIDSTKRVSRPRFIDGRRGSANGDWDGVGEEKVGVGLGMQLGG